MRITSLSTAARLAALALAATLAAGCHSDRTQTEADAGPAVEAETLAVQAVDTPVYAVVPGSVVSKRQAEIASRLTGYVRSVAVQAGDHVTAGQPLLSIDSSDVTGGMQQAQAGKNQAQAVFDEADTNYKRYAALFPRGAVSQMQLDAAKRQYDTAAAQLQAAQAALRVAEAQFGYADLRAPFTGVIVDKLVDAGDLATPGKPLLVLEDEHALEVQSYVPDELYVVLRLGDEIHFSTEDGAYTGRLQSKVEAADAQTHTHLIRISIPAGAGLRSGRYVRVSVLTGNQPRVRIPESALAVRAGITGVFVVDADGRAQFRLVRVGALADDEAEIQSGLSAGELIVVAPGSEVDNGTRIAGAGAAS